MTAGPTRTFLVLVCFLVLPPLALSQAPVKFDFDIGTPTLVVSQTNTPFSQTVGGLTAQFSSPTGGAFGIQSDASTGWRMSQFSGKYLYDNDLDRSTLSIRFSGSITALSLVFATADFQIEVPSNIQMTAWLDANTGTPVGQVTTHGAYAGDTMPMGTLTFNSGGRPFNLVELIVPFQTRGATTFFLDNITVTPVSAFASVSAASFAQGAGLAPGMIAAGYGRNLTTSLGAAPPGLPLPTALGGVAVRLRDSAGTERPCPLWFVSPEQINYYIPDGTITGLATVSVLNQNQVVVTSQLQIDSVSPGLFSMNNSGQGPAAALAVLAKADASQTWQYVFTSACVPGNCPLTPLDLGTATDKLYLQIYGTGIRGRTSLAAVSATVGGVAAPVEFAGPVEGLTGLDQVNILVPRSLAGLGEVDVTLTVDGKLSNTVKVNIK